MHIHKVCNLAWCKNVDEIVSTHGFSDNEIIIWRYPSMSRVATLSGHCRRALHLALSADSRVVITGAGDETLRFWHAFPGQTRRHGSGASGESPGVLYAALRNKRSRRVAVPPPRVAQLRPAGCDRIFEPTLAVPEFPGQF